MDDLLTLIAEAFLLFSHPAIVIAFFLAGFFFHDRRLWGVAILLTSFSMVLNPALKEFFQHPRPLGAEGYGFPSGHFNGSLSYYGWIALMWPNSLIRLSIAIILGGIGFGLVYKGYHFPLDLGGSFIVASLMIGIASAALKIQPFKNKPHLLGWLLLAFSSAPVLFLLTREGIPKHTWLGLACLTAVTILWPITPYLKDRKQT